MSIALRNAVVAFIDGSDGPGAVERARVEHFKVAQLKEECDRIGAKVRRWLTHASAALV